VSPPDLLFVGHGAERSGPPVFLANFQGWLAASTELDFATVLARGGPMVADYARWGDVRILDVSRSPGRVAERILDRLGQSRPAGVVRALRDDHRLGDWAQASAVYVNTVAPANLRVLRRVGDDTTVVLHVHELEVALRYGITATDRALMASRPDRYVAASQAVADNLVERHGIPADRITVHHEFITPVEPIEPTEREAARRRLGLPPDAFVVGGSGMTDWRKAPELFVRIAADLRARTDRTLAFVWVGGATSGPEWALVDHEARHLGVEDVVRFVGAQDQPGEWFRLLDAFALTSREDAFPLAALEAASAGVPVLTFDTGGMVEFVGDGEHGAVISYPDTGAFADVLAAWAADPEPTSALGAAAAAAVRARHVTAVAAPALWADVQRWIAR
jgi:glycosyltransferase involved in cell wall biosynthesis